MSDTQLYLAIGIPTFALVLGMIGNGFLFNALSARMTGLESRIGSLENRMLALEASMNTRFDLIMGRRRIWTAASACLRIVRSADSSAALVARCHHQALAFLSHSLEKRVTENAVRLSHSV